MVEGDWGLYRPNAVPVTVTCPYFAGRPRAPAPQRERFPGDVGVATELNAAIFFLDLQNPRRSPTVVCKRHAE